MTKWLVEIPEDDSSPHVVPLLDLRPHELTEQCWCRPYRDDTVIVHNSLDRREEYERGERRPN